MSEINTPWGPIGYISYKRTYSRRLRDHEDNSPTEEFPQTVDRVVSGAVKQLKVPFTEQEQERCKEIMLSLKGIVAGRFLWQLGTKTIDRLGLASLQNCFAGDTEFWTKEGIRKFSDFEDGDSVEVRGRFEWLPATVKSFGNQRIVELTIRNGESVQTIKTTFGHRWVLTDGSIKTTEDLCVGDDLPECSPSINCWKVSDITITDSIETVWCVVEPTKEEFTLACGVLTKNCAFTTVDHPIRPFTWAFDMLMLGSGVGYNIQREFVYKLPRVLKKKIKIERSDTKDADFIVPDSREGWVKLLGKVLKSYFYSGQGFTYSTICIRGRGASIKGFGGLASGPEDLVKGIQSICGVLDARKGKQLRPIDCLDIMNIIGSIVVAGNVRRSAQIAIGDYDDLEFLNAKNWGTGTIPNWRAMSNNSVVCNDFSKLPPQFWEGYVGNGEPYGLINLGLAQACGRVGETQYSDPNVLGFNPSLRAGTRVWTKEFGMVPIEELQDKEFTVKGLYGTLCPAKCWMSSPNAQLYKIRLKGGAEYYATAEHKWAVLNDYDYEKVTTDRLKAGMKLPRLASQETISYKDSGSYKDGLMVGYFYGDGWITDRSDNGKRQYGVVIPNNVRRKAPYLQLFASLFESEGRSKSRGVEFSSDSERIDSFLRSFGVDKKEKGIPEFVFREASNEFIKGFIEGYFDAGGRLSKDGRKGISSKDFKLIRDFQDLLGFKGHYYNFTELHLDGYVGANGKKYDTPVHRYSIRRAANKIGSETSIEIESVELTDLTEPVWDISVNDADHCFQLSGCITGNCAEQSLETNETCVTGDTWIPTKEGVFQIKGLVGKKVEVFNGEDWSAVTPFMAKKHDEFMKITFSDGSTLKATPYHEFSVSTPTNKKVFKKVKGSELQVGMYLPKFELPIDNESEVNEMAYTLGAFCGDGYIDSNSSMLCANKASQAEGRVATMYRAPVKEKDLYQWKDLRDKNLGLPSYIMSMNKVSILEFLAGWIDTDGSIRNKGSNGEGYIITGTSEQKLRDLQILCRRAGINFSSLRKTANKDHDLWVLQIPTFECRDIPTRIKIGFSFGERYKPNNAHKSGKLVDTAPRQRIVKIEHLKEKESSYCFSEPKRHMGVFNNVLTHQCCLAEIYLPNITSKEELQEVATYLYRINKHSLAIKCHHPETEEVVHRNMRMGIGVTGYCMATDEQKSWLSPTYEYLREYDKKYSEEHGFPPSIKLTTIKPSGCVSLDTKIRTSHGEITMEELFRLNEVNPFFSNEGFVDVSKDIYVYDENNDPQKITKLFINGISEVYELEDEDGNVFKFTPKHRLKTKRGWVEVENLSLDDEIVNF